MDSRPATRGGVALSTHAGGLKEIEKVKIGESPDGQPIYGTKGSLEPPKPGEELDASSPLPIIYRDGSETRIIVKNFP